MHLLVRSSDGTTAAIFPDRFAAPRRPPPQATFSVPFSSEAYPVTDVLANRTFLPSYPDRVSRLPARIWTALRSGSAPLGYVNLGLGWWPVLPPSPRVRLRVTQPPAATAPPLSAHVVIAQRMAWAPRMPAWNIHVRPTASQFSFLVDPTTVIAAEEDCVLLSDLDVTMMGLSGEVGRSSRLIDEDVTSGSFSGEEGC